MINDTTRMRKVKKIMLKFDERFLLTNGKKWYIISTY